MRPSLRGIAAVAATMFLGLVSVQPVGAASVTIEDGLGVLLPEHRNRVVDLYTGHPPEWPSEVGETFPYLDDFIVDAQAEGDAISIVLLKRYGIPDTSYDTQTDVQIESGSIFVNTNLFVAREVGLTVIKPLIVSILITGIDPGDYDIQALFQFISGDLVANTEVSVGVPVITPVITATPSPTAAVAGLALLGLGALRRRPIAR